MLPLILQSLFIGIEMAIEIFHYLFIVFIRVIFTHFNVYSRLCVYCCQGNAHYRHYSWNYWWPHLVGSYPVVTMEITYHSLRKLSVLFF